MTQFISKYIYCSLKICYTSDMNILLRWLISALIIMLVAYFLPGFKVASFYVALMLALILGMLNATMKPILIFLTFPFTVVTLGLWIFVINGFILWFIGTWLKGFEVNNFYTAVVAAALISIAGWFLYAVLDDEDVKRKKII